MRRPEVTSGQQSRVKREAEDDSCTTRLEKDRKKVETSNSHKESVGRASDLTQKSNEVEAVQNKRLAFEENAVQTLTGVFPALTEVAWYMTWRRLTVFLEPNSTQLSW